MKKIEFVHTDEYDDIEVELNAALTGLDEANARIEALLSSETHEGTALGEGAELDDEEPAASAAPETPVKDRR